jgi:hypothetical protein
LPDVITAVVEGNLVPTAFLSELHGISGYTFPLAELRKYRQADIANSDSDFLTIQEASTELKVDPRGVTALLRADYLNSSVKHSFRNERLIAVKDVASLKARYVFPRELAELNEVSLVWTNKYLAAIGIERIVLTGNQYYTFMYERRLVANMAIPSPNRNRIR